MEIQRIESKSIKPSAASKINIASLLNYVNTKLWVKFDGSCLKQEQVIFTHRK